MKASVIIITKNQKHFLQQSLPVLLSQNFKEDFEIIVIDSGSTDGAREYIKSLPVKLIEFPAKNFKYARAFNSGAKIAKGEFLIRLSGDAIPVGKSFLKEILGPFKNLNVGAVYGKYKTTDRKGWGYPDFWPAKRFPKKLTKYSLRPNFLKMILDRKFREEVFNLAGACCAIRREIWQKRPFNEKLSGAEDGEYAWFLHLAGYDIVCNPRAEVIHEHKIRRVSRASFVGMLTSRCLWQLRWEIAKYYLGRIV